MPDDQQSQERARELREWAKAVIVAIPLLIAGWAVLEEVPGHWDLLLVTMLMMAGLVAIGLASKWSVWSIIVWLGPLLTAQIVWFTGIRNLLIALFLVLAFVWTAGMMFSDRFGRAAFAAMSGVHAWLSTLGLPAAKRKAYRELRRALRAGQRQRRRERHSDDVTGSIRRFRESARRIQELVPPDQPWADVYQSHIEPFLAYADMLEGKQLMDYDEVARLTKRRDELTDALLRRESPMYRLLTYVPFR